MSASAEKRIIRSRKRRGPLAISPVARDTEFVTVLDHISKRKSLHIYGEEGVGKSAFLDQVYDFLKARGAVVSIYCRSSRTLRDILLQMALFLLGHFIHLESVDKFKRVKEIQCGSDIKKLSIKALRNIVYFYISLGDFCVILDHLEYVTPKINGFLTILYEKATVITASRQSWKLTNYSFKGRLDYCLYLIPKLCIENLKRKDAFLLIEILCRNLHADFPARQRMFEEVFRISKGNPGFIAKIFEKARRPEYHKDNRLDLRLIMLDSRMEGIMGKIDAMKYGR